MTSSHASARAFTDKKSLLRFITCGSVDDGKSSLIGRVLFESGSVPDDQLLTLEADSKKFGTQGTALDYALLVDGLSAEREQGITIDVAYRYFATSKRSFIVADTPGHEQYTRNMATGASNADLAVILVDARKGLLPQTRRHSFIVSMVGVKHVVVAVNKMDLVDYAASVFETIERDYRAIAKTLDIPNVTVIPVSAVAGDNIASPSTNTPWYQGPSLMDYLETVDVQSSLPSSGFAMPVQWVNRPDSSFRGYSGQIASGRIKPGDEIAIVPGGRKAIIDRIVTFDGDLTHAEVGQSVTLTLDRELDISRGEVIVLASQPLSSAKAVFAQLLWMSAEPLDATKSYVAKLATTSISAFVKIPTSVLDVETFAEKNVNAVGINSIFKTSLSFDRHMAVAPYRDNRDLGSFILIDRLSNEVVALGLVITPLVNRENPALGVIKAKRFSYQHDPFRRSMLKTISFAAGTLLLAAFIMLDSSVLNIALFAVFEIVFFYVHERLWARSKIGLPEEAEFLSSGEGI
jgi:bifunctional enzyme CysN/CysC